MSRFNRVRLLGRLIGFRVGYTMFSNSHRVQRSTPSFSELQSLKETSVDQRRSLANEPNECN